MTIKSNLDDLYMSSLPQNLLDKVTQNICFINRPEDQRDTGGGGGGGNN